MILGIGVDIIEVSRIKQSIENYGDKFLNRIYTQEEINYSDSFKEKKFLHYSARFAAKEAFSKSIGTGISQGFHFKEISIENKPNGEPQLILRGNTLEKYSDEVFHISLSHINDLAIAYVVREKL
ncbi:MAG TPA: holo-ACP synthase [Candidatus Kapabacteria bacterium]|jgi:holo-[acyl-carrier protein] synthase|nr:holo-ACP synthase [Candidatus Kapabacteria bacterium]HOV93196.1 holo-ACP synthase [Candidatus Kapabacteria bacterium]